MRYIHQIIEVLEDRDIAPEAVFAAAAGIEYGYAQAWLMPDGTYAVRFGSCFAKHYTTIQAPKDLPGLLLDRRAVGVRAAKQLADIYGIAEVEEASSTTPGPFCVLIGEKRRDKTEANYLSRDENFQIRKFATYTDASEWIEADKAASATTVIGTPIYKIVA